MTTTPEARIAEAMAAKLFDQLGWDWDGEEDGTCSRGGPTGVPSGRAIIREMAGELAAVVTIFPDIALVPRVRPCNGSAACTTNIHIHGCFADTGACDDPENHVTASYHRAAGGAS